MHVSCEHMLGLRPAMLLTALTDHTMKFVRPCLETGSSHQTYAGAQVVRWEGSLVALPLLVTRFLVELSGKSNELFMSSEKPQLMHPAYPGLTK